MSFLDKLFHNKKNSSSPNSPKNGINDELPELTVGMSLDVFNAEGKPMLTGRVSSVEENSLAMERLPGCLAFETCAVGDRITIRGFNRQMMPFNISGTVRESSRIVFRVDRLKAEHVVNQRLSFRLPVNSQAALYRVDDERLNRPEECVLVDVSTGGACVETDYIHSEEEVVRLRFKLEEYPVMTFVGQIVRGTEYSSGRYRYGVLFAQLKPEELTTLTRTLYNIQTGNRREWSRGMEGTWS